MATSMIRAIWCLMNGETRATTINAGFPRGVIALDNLSKKHAVTPALISHLSAHLTTFEDDDNLGSRSWIQRTSLRNGGDAR